MPRRYSVYQVDSFTRTKFSGNPAGVVTNAASLSDSEMQRIARELNNSETAFLLPPDDPSHDIRIRFFTPTHEVPVCGHATIAAHYVRAVENELGTTTALQKTGAGILPVEVVRERDDYTIIMTQGAIQFGERIEGENLGALVKALGITAADLRQTHPVQIASTGHSKVMICLHDETLLHRLTPDMSALAGLSGRIGCNGFYVFTQGAPGSDPLVHGRMFAPAIGINEDPVTGNANGPLGAYLVHHALADHDGSVFSFNAVQGEAVNRPGSVFVQVEIRGNEPQKVRITGHAVIAFATELVMG